MNKAVLIFPLIIFSLLSAIWTGWIRMGWSLPITNAAAHHGALMVNGFLASLIFLERAAAFKNKAVLLVPLIHASGVLALVFGPAWISQFLFIAGSSGFAAMCIYFVYRYKDAHYFIFLAGAFCLLTGNIILFKTNFYPDAVTWWMGFLLFTIVAERLELSRFLALTNFKRNLLWVCMAGVLLALLWPFDGNGHIVLAVSFVLTAIWLLKYDMARHSIKAKGQHRYSGLLLMVGYAWLLVTALLLVFQKSFAFGYDAVLHSFFIGFIFSMIFSHAVIILPAITRLPVRIYRPVLYLWFAFLQVSLMARIIGDTMEHIALRKIAGLASGAGILLFFISVASIMFQELQKREVNSSRYAQKIPTS